MAAESPLEPFDPRILAPHFTTAVWNALAEADADYLRTQLERHWFVRVDLAGADMHDEHGFFLTLRKSLALGDKLPPDFDALPERLTAALRERPARRVAMVLSDAAVPLRHDLARMLAFLHAINLAADALRRGHPPVQLCLFLLADEPGFATVDPVARRRAESHPGLKVVESDLGPSTWSRPRDFSLGPMHQYLVRPAAWYFLSRGHRAAGPDDLWHAYEHADILTFVKKEGGWPCIEGVFARTRDGMRLVGVRHETDPDRYHIPAYGEDPFTLFRGLCQQLTAWQARGGAVPSPSHDAVRPPE